MPGEAIKVQWTTPKTGPENLTVAAGEAKAIVTVGATQTTIYSFCVDMADFINPPTGNYAVTPLLTNSTNPSLNNGNEAAYLYNTYTNGATGPVAGGTVNGVSLTANEEASALQLAIWDLTNSNNGGITFQTSDSKITNAYNFFLTDAGKNGASFIGNWLAENNGDGQSFLYPTGGGGPNLNSPEPASFTLAFAGIGFGLALRRWRRGKLV